MLSVLIANILTPNLEKISYAAASAANSVGHTKVKSLG